MSLGYASSFCSASGAGSDTKTRMPLARKSSVQLAPMTPVPTTPIFLLVEAMIVAVLAALTKVHSLYFNILRF